MSTSTETIVPLLSNSASSNHDSRCKSNNSSMSLLLEEKIIQLSTLESERDSKRQRLDRLCTQYETIKKTMGQLETDLMGLDNDIEELERDIQFVQNETIGITCNNNNENNITIHEKQQQQQCSLNCNPLYVANKLKLEEDIGSNVCTEVGNQQELSGGFDVNEPSMSMMLSQLKPVPSMSISSDGKTSKTRNNEYKHGNDDDGDDDNDDDDDDEVLVVMHSDDNFDYEIGEGISDFTQTQRRLPLHHQSEQQRQMQPSLGIGVVGATGSSLRGMESLPLTTTTMESAASANGKHSITSNSTRNNPHQQKQQQQQLPAGRNGTLDAYFGTYNTSTTNNADENRPVHQQHKQQNQQLQQQKQRQESNSNASSSVPFTIPTYPWSNQIELLLHNTFKIRSFRDNQLDIINATLSGEDVFVIMRTGGGKSLTYQLPAVFEGLYNPNKKVTFVVSPLLSLIQDQVEQMNEFVPGSATSFTSGLAGGNAEHAKRWNQVRDPDSGICLVFVTPEKVHQSNKLCSEMEKLYAANRLGRFVIDECHCACQWGHDFRPDYAQLGKLKAHFPSIPVIAVTATASDRVRNDVCQILRINSKYKFFRSTANRPNLQYSVRSKADGSGSKDQVVIIEMVDYIKQKHPRAAGIVYTYSKKDADQVASALCDYGIVARAYHSEISPKQKELIHRSWMKNQTQVVVATIAFGLGINKPDVRFVLHHSISKTLEAYYQESGRAGRDGLPADCILFYSPKDFTRLLKMVHGSSSEKLLFPMIRYAQASGNDALCKAIILKHLGEPDCPNVKEVELANEGITTIKRDVGKHAQNVVRLLDLRFQEGNNKVTAAMLTKDWRTMGSNTPDFIKEHSPVNDGLSADDCERIIVSLILENVLQTCPVWGAYDTVIYLALGPFAARLLQSADPHVIVKLPKRDSNLSPTAHSATTTKASKQASTRKSIQLNGEWLSASNRKTSAKKVVSKGTATKKKKSVRKKSTTKIKKASTKVKRATAKNGAGKSNTSHSITTNKIAASNTSHTVRVDNTFAEVIELSSEENDEDLGFDDADFATTSESENEFE